MHSVISTGAKNEWLRHDEHKVVRGTLTQVHFDT